MVLWNVSRAETANTRAAGHADPMAVDHGSSMAGGQEGMQQPSSRPHGTNPPSPPPRPPPPHATSSTMAGKRQAWKRGLSNDTMDPKQRKLLSMWRQ